MTVMKKKIKNNNFRILPFLTIVAGMFITACPIEYMPGNGYRSGKYGDFQWYSKSGEITISKYTGQGSDVIVPPIIDKKPVTVIGNNSFRESKNLISITIPNGVKYIEDSAFYGCTELVNVTLPESLTLIGDWSFTHCGSLTGIVLPDNVTSIGEYAFHNCRGITDIAIPDNVEYIGKAAFNSCIGLTGITIPDSVIGIGERAFSGCHSLETIDVGSDSTRFSSTDGILYSKDFHTLVAYPNGKKGIADIPDGVTSIGDYAFDSCRELTSIIVPDSVVTIGFYAFAGCSDLDTISVGSGNTQFSSLDGILYSKDFSALFVCPNGKGDIVTIPDSVTRIHNSAFAACTKLTSINMPDGITSIEDNTFASCRMLSGITIPNSVTSIRNGAFWWCENLTSITIPENVTSIENNAFLVCTSLANVTFAGNNISSIDFRNSAFNGDLREQYLTGGIGTYIRQDSSYNWTKQY
jgi:hypothetical protein